MGDRDRIETQDEIELGTTVFLRAKERYASLPGLTVAMPGSMLAEEDAATVFDPISHQLARDRARAADALEMLLESMHDEQTGRLEARPMAMYALVRMSIEASAFANWTIQSSRKNDRIYRALQRSLAQLHEFADFADVVATRDRTEPYRRFRDDKTARLNELKDQIGALRQKELTKPPKLWQVLTAASATVRPGQPQQLDSPYVIWKVASNFLHGSDHVTRELGDIRQVTASDGVGASFEVTPSWRLLCSCVAACVVDLAKLDARTHYLATTAYGGRSLL